MSTLGCYKTNDLCTVDNNSQLSLFHTSTGQSSSSRGRFRIKMAVLLAFLLALGILAPSSFAQTANTGGLTGEVTDTTRAVVPDVQIIATNQATGDKHITTSRSDGSYTLSLLPPGSYRLEFSKAGFRTVVETGLQVNVTETARLSVQIAVGTVQQEITVAAQKELMETESASLGQVTSGDQITTLPLVNRNYTRIISLNPGVAADVTDSRDLGRGNGGNGGAPIVANGVSENDNNVQMNGLGANDLQSSGFFSGGVPIPNPDTIQEFKVKFVFVNGQLEFADGQLTGAMAGRPLLGPGAGYSQRQFQGN
jgi:hypothetical protein